MPLDNKSGSEIGKGIIPISKGGTSIVDAKPVITNDSKYVCNVYISIQKEYVAKTVINYER